GNPHRQVAPLTAARIGERDLPGAALNRLFQRDLERRLGVAAGLGPEPWLSPEAPAAAPPAPGTTGPEEHLEEVAEPPATAAAEAAEIEAAVAEVELGALPARRRRSGLARVLPRRAELVVLLALLRILQDLVGLADLLELELGLGVLVHVRVVLARQLPVRLLNVLLAGVFLDPQRRVIVLVVQRLPPVREPSRSTNLEVRGLTLSAQHSHCRTEGSGRPFPYRNEAGT